MESGTIDLEAVPGPMDLQATLESGQTFLWNRLDGQTYRAGAPSGGTSWYRTVHDGDVIEVRQVDSVLEWRSSTDPTAVLSRRLRLEDDLDAILEAFPTDPVLAESVDRFAGMRLVSEPFLDTLVSFILSAQMRVERIHQMVGAIRERYGEPIDWNGETVHSFPSPDRLAEATESELRDLGVGYRAPYIVDTARMVRDGEIPPEEFAGADYEAAREALTGYVGVGPKVADCVLLFSLDFPDPVPLDTWIQTAIEDHFPGAAGDSYTDTSRAIRDRLAPHPGYAQTYVFHHLRTRGADADSG